MDAVARLSEALRWLGRQGMVPVIGSLALGLAVPPLAALLKPLFAASVFCLMVLQFLRAEPAAFRGEFARPRHLAAAALWIMVAVPAALCPIYLWLGADRAGDGLLIALILQAVAPPVLSATAFSAILGLNANFSLAVLIVTTAVTPITAPMLVAAFAGSSLSIDPLALALRLALFLGSAFALAAFLRRTFGNRRVNAWREEIDGGAMVMIVIFGIALMDGVTARTIADPILVVGLTAFTFALSLFLYATTALAFMPVGLDRTLSLGFSGAHRNMAIMLSVVPFVPDLTWLYFATAQFPIYIVPALIAPFIRRLLPSRLPPG